MWVTIKIMVRVYCFLATMLGSWVIGGWMAGNVADRLERQIFWECPICQAKNVFAVVNGNDPIPEPPPVCVCEQCGMAFTRTNDVAWNEPRPLAELDPTGSQE